MSVALVVRMNHCAPVCLGVLSRNFCDSLTEQLIHHRFGDMFVESGIQASLHVLTRSVAGYRDRRNIAKLSNRIDKTYPISIGQPYIANDEIDLISDKNFDRRGYRVCFNNGMPHLVEHLCHQNGG